MSTAPSALERAYELARSGHCRGLTDIRAALKAEGYARYDSLLDGLGLRRQLKNLCDSSFAQSREMPGERVVHLAVQLDHRGDQA